MTALSEAVSYRVCVSAWIPGRQEMKVTGKMSELLQI